MSSLAWNRTHPEKMQEAQVRFRERHKEKLKEKRRIWYRGHPNYSTIKSREWRTDNKERNQERHRRNNKTYESRHPEKHIAQRMANDKNLPLASNCERCGSTEQLERHHPDYSKPLSIVTLCHSCHRLIHKNIGDRKQ